MEDNGEVVIQCPTFGISRDRHTNNDFVFISKTLKNIGITENKYAHYELYVYTNNRPAKGGDIEVHNHIIKWTNASKSYWPYPVKYRIDEYFNQCESRYRSVYTSHDGINPMAIVPLSKAVMSMAVRPEGIIKDSYNHIVGITYRSKAGSKALVAVPVIDDGVISISSSFSIKSIYLDWNDYNAAPADVIISYYKENINFPNK